MEIFDLEDKNGTVLQQTGAIHHTHQKHSSNYLLAVEEEAAFTHKTEREGGMFYAGIEVSRFEVNDDIIVLLRVRGREEK